jgi:hypothetical protein
VATKMGLSNAVPLDVESQKRLSIP